MGDDLMGFVRPSLAWFLAAPVAVYGVLRVVLDVETLPGITQLGLALALLPLATLWTSRPGQFLWLAPAVALLVGFLLSVSGSSSELSTGLQLIGGIVLGAPILILAALRVVHRSAPLVPLLILSGLLVVSALTVAGSRLGTTGSGDGAGSLATAFYQVNADQMAGLGSLLSGSASTNLPLQALPDLWFVSLALLALSGALLAVLRPGSEREGGEASSASSLLGPVLGGVVAATAFELTAVRFPAYALLAVSAFVLGTFFALLILIRLAPKNPWRQSQVRGPSKVSAMIVPVTLE
jgi:hypothetical protein